MKKQIALQRWIAWVLFVVSVTVLVMAGALTVTGAVIGIYDRPIEGVEDYFFRAMLWDEGWKIAAEYNDQQRILSDCGNIRYEITEADKPDRVLASNMVKDEILLGKETYSYDFQIPVFDPESGEQIDWSWTVYCVRMGVSSELEAADRYRSLVPVLEAWQKIGKTAVVLTGVSLLVTVVSGIWLCCLAGKRNGKEGIFERRFDRMPFLFILAFYGLAILGTCGLGVTLYEEVFYDWNWLGWYQTSLWKLVWALTTLVLLIDAALLALFLTTVAVRIKRRSFWKYTIAGKILNLIGKGMKGLPLVWKSALIYLGITVLESVIAMMIFDCDAGLALFTVLIEKTLFAIPLFWAVIMLKRLKTSVSYMANGNIGYKTDVSGLFGEFKEAALDLNRLSDGLGVAVEARTKSERMKTELITNVSHDIKTPLTSIVSYADLIGREETENEKIHEYADVLKRQSTKLKKLLEDLVEASKAATGNIKAEPVLCDAGVLITQAAGEYEEKLAEHDLTLITDLPETPVLVMADGRLTQRVLDNLMNNVSKYAKEGTRVFLSINDARQITIKNTSRDLILNPAELCERFVRGESSRTSDGNGLGLAIASGLMQTMGGNLEVGVDGDLFKVTLTFGGTQDA